MSAHRTAREGIVRRSTLVMVGLLVLPWRPGVPAPVRVPQAFDTSVVRARDDTRAQRLFGELMSPYCPGLTLAACPSPGADSLRQDIRGRLDRGETPPAIRAAYAADWGERILGAPPLRRWGVALWVTPGILLVLGALGLTLWLRTVRPAPAAAGDEALPPSVGDVSPADRALRERLEAELKAFDDAV